MSSDKVRYALARAVVHIALTLAKVIPPEAANKVCLFFIQHLRFLLSPFPQGSIHGKQYYKGFSANFLGIATITSPVGIAAGMDKNAMAIKGLFAMGFSIVEVGTVTPLPQAGNKKPRVKRLKDTSGNHCLINRMGFPNQGAQKVLKRVQHFNKTKKPCQILGINIGRNKEGTDEDYAKLISIFQHHCDYITVNASSPNTPNLRSSLTPHNLGAFLTTALKTLTAKNGKTTPILLKLSPDIDTQGEALAQIYNAIIKHPAIKGVIIANTTVERPNIPGRYITLEGGLSGPPLAQKALTLLRAFHEINTQNLTLISCGGISSKQEVEKRLNEGASAVQVYTAATTKAIMGML